MIKNPSTVILEDDIKIMSTGGVSIMAAGVIYSIVASHSDDPTSIFNLLVGFAVPLVGFAAMLYPPMSMLAKAISRSAEAAAIQEK